LKVELSVFEAQDRIEEVYDFVEAGGSVILVRDDGAKFGLVPLSEEERRRYEGAISCSDRDCCFDD
jgi:antitoxin (DNA-binding transcriptional repressor) of toxin-antitoxin stability system